MSGREKKINVVIHQLEIFLCTKATQNKMILSETWTFAGTAVESQISDLGMVISVAEFPVFAFPYATTAGTNLFTEDPVVSWGEDLDTMDITESPTVTQFLCKSFDTMDRNGQST